MKLSTLTHVGLGALLLTAGLTLASAEELVGTPVPLGDDPVISSEVAPPTIPSLDKPHPPVAPHPDWKAELDKELQHAFPQHSQNELAGAVEGLGELAIIPIVALLLIFGGPLLLVGYLGTLHYRSKARRRNDLNTNIDKLLAAGRDIPVELLRGDEPRRAEEIGNRDKGIRNLFLGIGWLLFLTIFFGIEIGSIGFIWIALGLSQLVIWKLNNPASNTTYQAQVGQQD